MISIKVEKVFTYPYLPFYRPVRKDFLLRRKRISRDGVVHTFAVKRIFSNIFVLNDDFKDGDVLEAVWVIVNKQEELANYSIILKVMEDNLIIAGPYKSLNEACLEFELQQRGRSLEEVKKPKC